MASLLPLLRVDGPQGAPPLPKAPPTCRDCWEPLPLLPSVLSSPLVLPPAASAAAYAARLTAAQGLKSAPLELLLRAPLLGGARVPPLLLGLLCAPHDESSLYSRESSVIVRMCFGK